MQECRKWHFGWNWVLYRYWKYIQKHTIQALHQVPTQTNDNFRAKIRCQETRKNKGILSIKWLLLQNAQNALTTLLHWADDLRYWLFWSTASYDVYAVYSTDNSRISSAMILIMWCCVKSQDNDHVLLYQLVDLIDIVYD